MGRYSRNRFWIGVAALVVFGAWAGHGRFYSPPGLFFEAPTETEQPEPNRQTASPVSTSHSKLLVANQQKSGAADTEAKLENTAYVSDSETQELRGIDELMIFPRWDQPLSDDEAWNLIASAESGNPVAQTSLGSLMKDCGRMLQFNSSKAEFEANRRFFEEQTEGGPTKERWDRMEQTMQTCWVLGDAYQNQEISPEEWLRRAARQNYGPGLALLAEELLFKGAEFKPSGLEYTENEPAARTLFDAALRTRHPHAVFSIGLGQKISGNELFPNHVVSEPFAWIYAACHYGFDCSAGNHMVQNFCQDSGDCGAVHARSLTSYIGYLMFTPREADIAAEHALELIELIDAGEWHRLRLTLPDDPSLDEILNEPSDNSGPSGADG